MNRTVTDRPEMGHASRSQGGTSLSEAKGVILGPSRPLFLRACHATVQRVLVWILKMNGSAVSHLRSTHEQRRGTRTSAKVVRSSPRTGGRARFCRINRIDDANSDCTHVTATTGRGFVDHNGRRGFLAGAIRYLALGTIAVLSGGLLMRNRAAPAGGCPRARACSGCADLARCDLPQAAASRQDKGKG